MIQIYLLKDLEKIGIAGSIVRVSEGFAMNFIIPRKLGVKVTNENMKSLTSRVAKVNVKTEVVNSKLAMMAEHIKTLVVTLKERTHNDGKLYGSVGAAEVVDMLKEKGINVDKKQVEFDKTVRSIGEHKVAVRLNSKLRPQFTLKVVGQKTA